MTKRTAVEKIEAEFAFRVPAIVSRLTKHERRALANYFLSAVAEARAPGTRMKRAIRWVCGEIEMDGWFGEAESARTNELGKRLPFWWRSELRKRAKIDKPRKAR